MSFFTALVNIGVTPEQLQNLTKEDRIRIEKKLLAEQRLNGTLQKNDVEVALRILNEQPDALAAVFQYPSFYTLLTGGAPEKLDVIMNRRDEIASIKQFVAEYLDDDVMNFINTKFQANEYDWLLTLTHYRRFLSEQHIEYINRRLAAKITSAIALINAQPDEEALLIKAGHLQNPDFYDLIVAMDARRFYQPLRELTELLLKQLNYTINIKYFAKVIEGLQRYSSESGLPIYNLYTLAREIKGSSWSIGLVMIGIVGFIVLIAFLASWPGSTSTSQATSGPRKNRYESVVEQQPLYYQAYEMDNLRIKMENFVEARMYPLSYPMQSWQGYVVKPHKYANPFQLDIFYHIQNNIRHQDKGVMIFNQTHQACVAIAYYRMFYDAKTGKYKERDQRSPVDFYALYIPPMDSIKIDAEMALLRFYTGHRLTSFNSYRSYSYPDSLDVKFAKTTPADSALFSHAFIIRDSLANSQTTKNYAIYICQPKPTIYTVELQGSGYLQSLGDYSEDTDVVIESKANARKEKPDTNPRKILINGAVRNPTDKQNTPEAFLDFIIPNLPVLEENY